MVTISAAIMVAVLNIYTRAQATAASINAKLDSQMLPNEIVQRIAEDLDRLTSPGLETTIAVANKTISDLNVSQLIITTKFYGKGNPPKSHVFEEVIWQSDYDPETDSIILYRLHGGINIEDKVVNKELLDKPISEREQFIPITSGITFFEIVTAHGDSEFRAWSQTNLPRALRLRISFAEPVEDMDGNFAVAEEEMVTRTVAIDRTRMIRYKFVRQDFKVDEPEDPNAIDDSTEDVPETEGEGATEGTTESEGEGSERPKTTPIRPPLPGEETG